MATVQTPAPSLALPATCLAARHSSSPAPSAATTRPPPLLRASLPHPLPGPPAVLLALPIAGTAIAPPIRNRPSCGRPPHTVPLACTEPRRSPLLEHLYPDSSRWRRGRLTPSWTPLPLSPLPPRHNPPPSPHLADPRFAAAEPTVRPSPFPPQQTDPEPQSPSWTSHTSSFGNISTDCSIRFPKICPVWEPHFALLPQGSAKMWKCWRAQHLQADWAAGALRQLRPPG